MTIQTPNRPELSRAFLADNPEYSRIQYELRLENPSNTTFITIRTIAPLSEQDVVEDLHRDVLSPIMSLQADRVETRRTVVEQQLARVGSNIDRLSEMKEPPMELILSYSDRENELESLLGSLTEGDVVQYAARDDRDSNGEGASLILALGGILGIMAGFIAEFGSRVRDAMATHKS